MNNVIKITGLDCANCARELEEELSAVAGVKSVSVDFMAQKVYADCTEEAVAEIKNRCNRFEDVKVVEDMPEDKPEDMPPVDGERIKITGLCCANCARELEEILNKTDGVTATVDFMNMCVILNADSASAREQAVYKITHFEDVKIADAKPQKKSAFRTHLKEIIAIAVSALFFIPAVAMDLAGVAENGLVYKILIYCFFGIAYISVGYKVLWNTLKNVSKGRIFDENFLMTVASLGAIALGIFAGDGFAEGVAVMFLYQIGELLQSVAVGKSRGSISALMDLKSETATLKTVDGTRAVPPEQLKTGDVIIIKAGEKVPVDCKILSGASSLDMKSLNGEPVPRDVKEGDGILSGSINLSGVLEAEVVREYKNSAVAKILELVENSTAKKSKPEKFITKFAKYYTPAVCLAAVLLAGAVPTVICAVNSSFAWPTYADWIYKALGFLVISCPCALVISVPLSYFGGIGRCAKSGILVKGSTCLDALAGATVAAFDKTGTLTEGAFSVVSYTDEKTLALAAAAEKFSSHPIAAAFKDVKTDFGISGAEEIAGKGVKCLCGGEVLLCGNAALLEENGVIFDKKQSFSTLVYVALGGKFVGVIEIDDAVKSGAQQAVAQLKAQGVTYTAMLTGDGKERAEAVADAAGLDGCFSGLLPDEKLAEAEKLKQKGKLIYVGDGINDAPVMTAADCAVSMGKVGSDAAIEASDIVLVSDNLSSLPLGRKIAKGTRSIVLQNIIGSLAVKAVIMILSVAVPNFTLPLFVSVIADVGVMLVAVLNAMRTALIK
ncbi:MAG: cadmium-translocating P-type ATPase [Clostridia bacterium]|jgi:Cd2+/Zn2+-exporting ATPase|nr:cadmium-translocating P-type ATPase [Clostridia bacterium]